MSSDLSTRPIRVLVAKAGLDGHDRGAKIIARALRDAGMEVLYTGLRKTPESIVHAAIQEDVDCIGRVPPVSPLRPGNNRSCGFAAYLTVFPDESGNCQYPIASPSAWSYDYPMQTRMESNGDIVVPGELGRKLGYCPGDTFDLRIEAGGIMVAPHEPAKQHVGKIIEDPLTGWPVFDPGPDAPVLTNEQVLEMLAEFP